MAHADDIVKLRNRFVDAVKHELVTGESADFYQSTLLSIMNDAERQRQEHIAAAQRLREQAIAEEGQAKAFSAMSSMVYNVLNGFISKAEEAAREETELKAEEDAE
jgi:hypothetical protein